jgi:2,3-bisphosphoglycerate-independent phosphoglycerate mutase
LIKAAQEAGIPETFIHFFCDGRDTAPKSGHGYLNTLLVSLKELNYGKVATITGRYYAMDRDKRWERVQVAYEALVQGKGEASSDPLATIATRYEQGETDEFLKPIIVDANGVIKDKDTIIAFNFRSDRMREIAQALGIAPLPLETAVVPKDIEIISMTQYKADFPFKNIFPPQTMANVLAEWLGKLSVTQSHIAETEKYAHVTFFFNGGTEKSYPLEGIH